MDNKENTTKKETQTHCEHNPIMFCEICIEKKEKENGIKQAEEEETPIEEITTEDLQARENFLWTILKDTVTSGDIRRISILIETNLELEKRCNQ